MLGPMFLSWDGNEETYQRFLSHLRMKLKKIDRSKLVLGTDQEIAMINAFENCFPEATHILCTKHLKDNAREHLRKSKPQPIVAEILNKIFNDGGLLCAENSVVYNELEIEIIENYNVPYLNNTLLPNFKEKVFEPRRLNNNKKKNYCQINIHTCL